MMLPPSLGPQLSPTADGSNRFRWVEIWLGILFPSNSRVLTSQEHAEELLRDLKAFKRLDKLGTGDLPDTERHKALQISYRKLWEFNGDDQYKDLQTRIFHVAMGALEPLTPEALFEAVRFNAENPTNLNKLKFTAFEDTYCNFLKTNRSGHLEFEHQSAKVFVSEMKDPDSDKLIFSEKECNRVLANMAIGAIKSPGHVIWNLAGVRLVDWGTEVKTSLHAKRDSKQHVEKLLPRNKRWAGYGENGFSDNSGHDELYANHFGTYLFWNWLQHCQELRDEENFVQRMAKLFRDAHPGLEGYVLSRASRSQYGCSAEYDTVCSSNGQQGGDVIFLDPFLCMVAFNFSPFSRGAEQPLALLPGFEEGVSRNLGQRTALHIACLRSDSNIVEDLLRLKFARLSAGHDGPLSAQDSWGRIPLHYARTDDVAKALLRYHALQEGLPFPPAAGASQACRLLNSTDKENNTPFQLMAYLCSTEFVQWVLDRYQVDRLEQVLFEALRIGMNSRPRRVAILAQHVADINLSVGSQTALTVALRYIATFDDADILLSNGAALEAVGAAHWTGMDPKLDFPDFDIIRGILDMPYRGALAAMAAKNMVHAVEYLLKKDLIEFDKFVASGEFGTTLAVAVACSTFHNTGRMLIQRRKTCNVPPGRGEYGMALAVAAASGDLDIVIHLLEQGAEVNEPLERGDYGTALIAAAARGNTFVVK